MLTALRFNPRDPAFVADPYSFYRELRETDPVHHEPLAGWLISRYQDVARWMGDPRLVNVPLRNLYTRIPGGGDTAVPDLVQQSMLFSNPPLHDHTRSAFATVFRPALIARLRPLVRTVVAELTDAAAEQGSVEFVYGLAYPMVALTLGRLLGLPDEDCDAITGWASGVVVPALEAYYGARPADELGKTFANATSLVGYTGGAVAERQRSPRDDLLSAMATAADAEHRATQELVVNVALLLAVGIPKAAYYLSNAVLTLLRHPAQFRELAEDPTLAESAADELLRYETPVQIGVPQIAADDIEVGGRYIAQGDQVLLMLGSANRDPERFADPDRLDLRRPAGRHIGFGVGLHNCIGAMIVRVLGQEALPFLVRRFPGMHLDPVAAPPSFVPGAFVRQLNKLPLVLG